MKLINAFFCDDIRFESRNKLSLMGLYDDRMIYPENITFPINARLAILLKFSLDKKETKPRFFLFKYFMNNNELINVPGEMQPDTSNENIQLVINVEGLTLELGKLGYSIELFDEKKKLLLNKQDMAALEIMVQG